MIAQIKQKSGGVRRDGVEATRLDDKHDQQTTRREEVREKNVSRMQIGGLATEQSSYIIIISPSRKAR